MNKSLWALRLLLTILVLIFSINQSFASELDWRIRCEGGTRVVSAAEMFRWCGAQCLSRISNEFGVKTTYGQIRRECDEVQFEDGVLSLSRLQSIGERLGLGMANVDCESDWLFKTGVPAITVQKTRHFDKQTGVEIYHAILLLRVDASGCHIYDPAEQPSEFVVSSAEFLRSWSGRALVCRESRSLMPAIGVPWTRHLYRWLVIVNSAVALIVLLRYVRNNSPRLVKVLSIVIAMLTNCQGCGSDGANSKSVSPNRKAPLLEFEELSYSFDNDEIANRHLTSGHVQHKFQFSNRHNRAVLIERVDTSCSCTAAHYPTEAVRPGASAEIDLVLDLAGRRGMFRSTCTVVARVVDEGFSDVVELVLDAYVLPPSIVVPETVVFPATLVGNTSIEEVLVRTYAGQNGILPVLTWSGSSVDYQVELIDSNLVEAAGFQYAAYHARISYTPKIASVDSKETIVWSFSDGRESIKSRVAGRSNHPDFELVPRSLDFGAVVGSQVECSSQILWRNDDCKSPLQICDYQCDVAGTKVVLIPHENNLLVFRITFPGETPRIFSGKIMITSVDKLSPNMSLDFRGFRQLAPVPDVSSSNVGLSNPPSSIPRNPE